MTQMAELKKKWMQEPGFREEYDALEEEFSLARELIEARCRKGLSQAQVAKRMGTTQSVIARLESGAQMPSMKTVQRYAAALGSRAVVKIESDT